MELRGYRMKTSLNFNELYAHFSNYFGNRGWDIWRWADAEMGAKDGKDICWLWILAMFLLTPILAIFGTILYWLGQERREIKITKADTNTYFITIKGNKTNEEFKKFADSIDVMIMPTHSSSKTTTGEIFIYLTIIFAVIWTIILVLAFL